MRDDLAKQLCEKPRRYRGNPYRYSRHAIKRDHEGPAKQSMMAPYRWDTKSLSDHLAPLEGLLRKSVGRPWDKLFSELSAALKGGYTVIAHVKQHLYQYVELNPRWVGGKPHRPPHRTYGGHLDPLNDEYYVDRVGVIRWAPKRPRWRSEPEPVTHVRVDNETAYHKFNGLWYRVWLRELPTAAIDQPDLLDICLDKHLRVVPLRTYYTFSGTRRFVAMPLVPVNAQWAPDNIRALKALHGGPRYAYRRQQLNSREIRRAGLPR